MDPLNTLFWSYKKAYQKFSMHAKSLKCRIGFEQLHKTANNALDLILFLKIYIVFFMLLLYQSIKFKSKQSKTLFIFFDRKKAPFAKTVKEEILFRYKHIDNEKQEPIEFR